MKIGKKIQEYRQRHFYSQDQLSNELGWNKQKLSRLERDKQSASVDDLAAITGLFSEPITSLLDMDGSLEQMKTDVSSIGSLFVKFRNQFMLDKQGEFSGCGSGTQIRTVLPGEIANAARINDDVYKLSGSIGQGGFAEIPWICIFNKAITTKASYGIYIVYLFSADGKRIYLSLNQGFTAFREKYGARSGRAMAARVSRELRARLNINREAFELDSIDLSAQNDLGRGYEACHILGKSYHVDNLPSDATLVNDLRNLMAIYEEVLGLIGVRSLQGFYDELLVDHDIYALTDDEYVHAVVEDLDDNSDGFEYSGNPKDKPDQIFDKKGGKSYPRDKRVAKNAFVAAGYKCEYDPDHVLFIKRSNQKPYLEPHHLILLSAQDKFNYSLDVEENIVCLCSQCHDRIHYSIDSEKLIEKLYEKRIEMLRNVGLEIALNVLKELYRVNKD